MSGSSWYRAEHVTSTQRARAPTARAVQVSGMPSAAIVALSCTLAAAASLSNDGGDNLLLQPLRLDGLGERSLLEDEAEDEHRGQHEVANRAEEVVLARDVPGWGAGRCRTGRVLVYSPGPRSRSRSRKPSEGRLGTGASAPCEPPWARTRQP